MLNFAVIKDGKVDNIIVADSLETAEQVTGYTCVPDDGTAQIGFGWNGSSFEEPVLTIPEETPTETPTEA